MPVLRGLHGGRAFVGGQVAVQRCLGVAGLGTDLAVAVALAARQPGVLDLVGGVGEGTADLPPGRVGDGAGVGGTLSGEGAFYLGEQGQQQEGDAACALIGGVDGQRVGQGPHSDVFGGQVVQIVQALAMAGMADSLPPGRA
jgi:hypothetical protein